MRKLPAILLMLLYLTSSTEFYQVLKLPLLVSHFFDHKGDDPSLSVKNFLVMHYGNHGMDNDYQKDMQLPFKTHAENSNISASNIPAGIVSLQDNKFALQEAASNPGGQNFDPREAPNAIFQPPRSI